MMLVGRDKKWSKKGRPDPATVASAKDKTSTRIIFRRHGEKCLEFNIQRRPKILVPFKACTRYCGRRYSYSYGWMMIVYLYDSPLNEEGLAQARELNDLIENYRGEHLGDVQAMRDPVQISRVFF